MKHRIWELDAFRGLCILGMILVHLVYDSGIALYDNPIFRIVRLGGGIAFVLLSGICVTLGSRSTFRGAVVLGCGMVCTAVTGGMHLLSLASKGVIIYFGVLHCLGFCMLVWPVLRRLPKSVLWVLGAVLAVVGLVLEQASPVNTPWLIPLGLTPAGFTTSDYFPLLPYLGYFLLGAGLGRWIYSQKHSLFPRVDPDFPPVRFLCLCGRHSLLIYLLHQPILCALLWAIH